MSGTEMLFLSEVFLVTYSILYGIMLNACLGLQIFPFGRLFRFKAIMRIMFSFLIINAAPLFLFSVVLLELEARKPQLNLGTIFGVFLLSLVVFVFYRIIHLIISSDRCRKFFYDLDEERKRRVRRIASSSLKGQLFGCVFYGFLSTIGWFFVFILFN